jgi:PadR family transcriptional regulator, regulatory protein PadR
MAGRLLTDFELMVLLAILRIGEDAYGVPIAREIEQIAKRPVVRAVIYAALDRLQQRGLVTSAVGDPTPQRGGRAKRFYRVSAKGLRAVKDTRRALTALWTGIPALEGGVR